jgi:hypothetical protein
MARVDVARMEMNKKKYCKRSNQEKKNGSQTGKHQLRKVASALTTAPARP